MCARVHVYGVGGSMDERIDCVLVLWYCGIWGFIKSDIFAYYWQNTSANAEVIRRLTKKKKKGKNGTYTRKRETPVAMALRKC